MYSIDFKKLKKWFLNESRDLPWRNDLTPYSIWISEVMLQQTQVAVVIPYFERWMQRFPDVKHLSEAKLEEVIKLWEGLGYYSRARSLHEGAIFIMNHFDGKIPDNPQDLSKIKGLGPYTIGAILSFAFHKKAAAVDGNVIRVLTRYFNIDEDVSKHKTVEFLRKIAFDILPEDESWIQNEALIELGAVVCSKKPKCLMCPLKDSCKGYKNGTTEHLPVKTKKTKVEYLTRTVPIIYYKDLFLVKKENAGKIMKDLHEFPYITHPEDLSFKEVEDKIFELFQNTFQLISPLNQEKHSFTRYQVTLNPFLYQAKDKIALDGYKWMSLEDLNLVAFSSGHKKLLIQLNFLKNKSSLQTYKMFD